MTNLSDKELIIAFSSGLDFYQNRMNEMKEKLGSKTPDGYYVHFIFPEMTRYQLMRDITHLKSSGNDISALCESLKPIDAEIMAVRNARRYEYANHMRSVFRNLINSYATDDTLIKRDSFEKSIINRDNIEALRMELEKLNIDISQEITAIDKKDTQFLSNIPRAIENFTYSPVDLFTAPSEIWWRHLEEKYGKSLKNGVPDAEVIQQFWGALAGYKTSIDEIKKQLGKKRSDGEYIHVFFPAISRMPLQWMVEYLRKRGQDITTLDQALNLTDTELAIYREAHREEYLDHLLSIFRSRIKSYENLEYAFIKSQAFDFILEIRDEIEAMKIELESLADIDRDAKKIFETDEFFKSKIPESIKDHTFFPMDSFTAPSEIWWRHLKEKYGEPLE